MDGNTSGSLSSKFLPKTITARRRRKQSASAEDLPVGDSSGAADLGKAYFRERSRAAADSDPSNDYYTPDGDDSSEVTPFDSDPALATRPSVISKHPSQIGYLTTSSPLVYAVQRPQSRSADKQTPAVPVLSVSPVPNFPSTAPDKLASLDSAKAGITPSTTSPSRRSPSVGRIRDVFRSRKGTASSGLVEPTGSETRPGTPATDKQSSAASSVTSFKLAKPGQDSPQKEQQPPSTDSRLSSTNIRHVSVSPRIDTSRPPQTPPQQSADRLETPLIVNTPPTPTDPSHPTSLPHAETETKPASPADSLSYASPPKAMIAQRRARAGSASLGPSKLSNFTSAPLTPTPENPVSPAPPTSGASNSHNNSTSNFFSSMFSAVQNTANTFSNSITNSNSAQGSSGSRPKTATAPKEQKAPESEENSVQVESSPEALPEQASDSKEPAVRTLGLGDLSLSHLGIVEAGGGSSSSTPVKSKFGEFGEARARSESAPMDVHVDQAVTDLQTHPRPQSVDDQAGAGAGAGEGPPPEPLVDGKGGGVRRSASIRSAIDRTRRKRGSSAATGASGNSLTIGAAISAANSSFANPIAPASAPKLTGFAVATKKRNRDFHSLFKSVPDDDYLIEDYSCALQREILAHGRLYVSEGHLCFSSNILGWATTLVMSFDEIVSVEKRNTALVFKNGLEISTLHAKHIFASFTSRDTTYDLIVKIWKLGHPGLQSSLNGVRLEEMGGDKTEKVADDSAFTPGAAAAASQSESVSEDEDTEEGEDVYDEDEGDGDMADTVQAMDVSSSTADAAADKATSRKVSGVGGVTTAPVASDKDAAAAATAAAAGATSPTADFPGPATHAPTECGDAANHFERILGDDVVPAPLGKLYTMMFGSGSAAWMGKWLTGDQKCLDLQMEDKRGLSDEIRSRSFSYIRPLNAAIGPRQTKCIVTERIETLDLDKVVTVVVSTQNPDVPSGNIFSVKTRYCLTWADHNATRIQINNTIEWTGKSWLKGPIEKGAIDGQTQYCKDLFASLKIAVSVRPRSSTSASGGVAGVKVAKKRIRKANTVPVGTLSPVVAAEQEAMNMAPPKEQSWGLLEPIRPIASPFVSTLRPILTGNVVYGLLVGLLVAMWFGFGSNTGKARPHEMAGGAGVGPGVGGAAGAYYYYPPGGPASQAMRTAAYEEMWRREESDLWEWIEARAGVDRLLSGEAAGASASGGQAGARQQNQQQQTPKKKAAAAKQDWERLVEDRIRDEKMDERELREAVRVTEERLKVLKSVVNRKAQQQESAAER